MTDDDRSALGVYVHWPYCARICPYCDFNVYKSRSIDPDAWISAFRADLQYARTLTGQGGLTSLYFGGGTPSLAPPAVLDAVIAECDRLWGFHQTPEITLEANPVDLKTQCTADWKSIGVNRISLGVQSFNDEALRFLGRDHDKDMAARAIGMAQATFGNVTFDLIFGLPGQSLALWEAQLTQALTFETGHLSLYQLTIEPGTAFARAADRGTLIQPDDGMLADFYDHAVTRLRAHDYDHYEISNFARPGLKAKHNLLYWTYQDYVGIGPGAHGRITSHGKKLATLCKRRPADYLSACKEKGYGLAEAKSLSTDDQIAERLLMGLRLEDGIVLATEDPFFGHPERRRGLERMLSDGLLIYENSRLRASEAGRRVLNSVLTELLATG